MNLHTCMLTENDCYKAGKPLSVRGLMLHSTGAPNTRLSRYVGPDDGLVGYLGGVSVGGGSTGED